MEFVVVNEEGKEIDWVDPIVKLWETPHYWYMTNGERSMITGKPFIYRFWKYEGFQYLHRTKVES